MSKAKKPIVVSFFTGAGGLDEGFRAAGFEIGCCVELEKWACDTLRKNHPKTPVMGPPEHSGDIKEISASDIYKFSGITEGEIDVLIGGPPCQPFSQAATQRFLSSDDRFKRLGFNDEKKGTLLFDYIDLILEIKPRVFLLENVPGLMTVDGGKQLQNVLKILRENGYSHTEPQVIDAVAYGVPQNRKRLIIWGSRTIKNPRMPEATNTPIKGLFNENIRVVAHALSGMVQSLPNHVPRSHSESSILRYKTLKFGQREKLGRVDRLDPCMPSKTVIAGGSNGGGRSHLHPFIARTMTVRECARLQTFKDSYVFEGSIARQFTQVGNAVPPLLAEKIARKIMETEFNQKPSTGVAHGAYLNRAENIEELTANLLKESLQQMPEWVYNSHS